MKDLFGNDPTQSKAAIEKREFNECLKVWFEFYPEFVMDQVQGKSLKYLIKKVKAVSGVEDTGAVTFNFMMFVRLLPQRFKGKDFKRLNSCFNEIWYEEGKRRTIDYNSRSSDDLINNWGEQ